jgi:hypothetical protein
MSGLILYRSQRNQDKARFLRLPVEPRQKVYEYVISGWQVHGSSSHYEYDEDADDMKQVMYCRQMSKPTEMKWIPISGSGMLAMLTVSRQTSADIRGFLPFKSSIEFVVDSMPQLLKFSERLSKNQRNSLANLRLHVAYTQNPHSGIHSSDWVPEDIPRHLRELGFVGLKEFTVELRTNQKKVAKEHKRRLLAVFDGDDWWASRKKGFQLAVMAYTDSIIE